MYSNNYVFFVDDCGTRTICREGKDEELVLNQRCFGLGGIIVRKGDIPQIEADVKTFCNNWNVEILHGSKIRSGKGKFSFLNQDRAIRETFYSELQNLIVCNRIVAHGCVICRPGYRDRYADKHSSRWDMSKTAFDIILERAAKLAIQHSKKLSIVYERSGKKEDRKLENYYKDLKAKGLAFNTNNSQRYAPLTQRDFDLTLDGMDGETKSSPLLQLADLVIHPICDRVLRKRNRAFEELKNRGLLIDDQHKDASIALKYSCFDGRYEFLQ